MSPKPCDRGDKIGLDELHAKVARLEGELEKWKSAYQREVRAVEKVARERDTAQAANAEMAAALRRLAVTEAGTWERGSKRCAGCNYSVTWEPQHADGCFVNAALSPDAGKGWLPPEVREQVRAALVLARRRLHPRSASYIVAEVDKAIAALDALKGVE